MGIEDVAPGKTAKEIAGFKALLASIRWKQALPIEGDQPDHPEEAIHRELPVLGGGTEEEARWLEAVVEFSEVHDLTIDEAIAQIRGDFAFWLSELKFGLRSMGVGCHDGHKQISVWRHHITLVHNEYVVNGAMQFDFFVTLVVDAHRKLKPNCRLTYEQMQQSFVA